MLIKHFKANRLHTLAPHSAPFWIIFSLVVLSTRQTKTDLNSPLATLAAPPEATNPLNPYI